VRELYIYYRVRAEREAAVREAATAASHRLCTACPGLAVQWRRRPPDEQRHGDPGVRTWMEIWTHPHGIDVNLAARIETAAAAWQGMIDGSRHVEVFETLDGPPLGGAP
jgi:hypothetical protein